MSAGSREGCMLKEEGDSKQGIRQMFGRISGRYDLMNKLITMGMEGRWKRLVARLAASPGQSMLLDVGAGTGGIALEARRINPSLEVIALDFSIPMMEKGRLKEMGATIGWCAGDALNLPFGDMIFDAVTSGYLIRNVPGPLLAFKEQYRVLRPGGRVVCLDTSPPGSARLAPAVKWYLRLVIPMLGSLIAGDRSAYCYLASSTESFMTPEEVAGIMTKAGFENVRYWPQMLGTQMILTGIRPEAD
ncbi:MAG: hypothetical protein COX16_10935 [Deltaproteobacteria bacterium CG23_combo_of_CG06-09_8_20_14_all_51_20]|nr:MAG: hypothetical protein COX16_10935 [Deltaproteobacteria bacterium CG23_combo_of_CG06-09_8_20_14_all_51_20]PIY25545.1 MAG: hypothetical protein COZ11_05185 [Deltaproteobacteria bacterium CG_4_10_14_3_um_filter_51_14]PJB36344.1 MAG: hypothetical protein CO107_08000 [Deltaproteobacteria bacterium CG_4_9_14_3_um_filter_51_14]